MDRDSPEPDFDRADLIRVSRRVDVADAVGAVHYELCVAMS